MSLHLLNCLRDLVALVAAIVLARHLSVTRRSLSESTIINVAFRFRLPARVAFGQVLFDPLPDGRLLVAQRITVSVETAPENWHIQCELGDIAGFTRRSGRRFCPFRPTAPAPRPAPTAVARWPFSNTGKSDRLVTNYVDARFRRRMDTTTATWPSPTSYGIELFRSSTRRHPAVTTVSSQISAVHSAGVAFDAAGNLYTGNGFRLRRPSGSSTGWVKAFSAGAWQNALATSTPLRFRNAPAYRSPICSPATRSDLTPRETCSWAAAISSAAPATSATQPRRRAAVASALTVPQASPPITPASSAAVLRKFATPGTISDNLLPFGTTTRCRRSCRLHSRRQARFTCTPFPNRTSFLRWQT